MKKALVLSLGLVLALSLLAPAGAAKRRTAEERYEFSPLAGPGVSGWFDSTYGIFFGGAAEFPTHKGERAVTISVTDDSGRAVAAAVWQEAGDLEATFCGTSPRLRIKGGAPLQVQVFMEATPVNAPVCGAPELPTTGTITARF
jgi:hypothetical protein